MAAVSLLPLFTARVLLLVAPKHAERILEVAHRRLERHAVQVALVLVALLAVSLFRGGIAGLTS